MKKTFGLIFISLYSLLFFIVLTIFAENDNYNVYNSFSLNDQYDHALVYFDSPLQDDEKIEVIELVEELANDYELAVTVTDYIEKDGQIVGIKNYVSGENAFIQEMLPENMKIEEDFYKGKQYISNDAKAAKNKIDLFTFYKGLTYEVIPFHFLEDNLETIQYDLNFHFSAKDRVLFENIIENEFSDFNISIGSPSHAHYNRNEELAKSIAFISVIALVLFILFILFTISYQIKDIAILKLNGFTMIDTLSYIFKDNLLSSAVLALLVPMFLSAIVFRTFNLRIIEFYFITVLVGLILVFIFMGLILLSTVVIDNYRLSDFIKNKNINSSLTKITYGLLILSSITILPMSQKSMNELVETVKGYTQVKINARKIDHIQELTFNQESRGWEFDLLAQLNNEPNENNQRQIELYDDLDEMNAIYHFRPTVFAPQSIDFEDPEEFENQEELLYSGYTVNEKYFEEANFLSDNKEISIGDSNALNVLMDIQTFESYNWQKADFARDEENVFIYIFDHSDYLNIENETIEGYENHKAPIFLYTENENHFMKNISDGGFYIDDRQIDKIHQYLVSEDLENEIGFYPINERESLYREGLIHTLRDTGIEVLPSLISLLAVFISFTNFHSLEKKREIKILKSMGYKTLAISKNYISKILSVNVIFIFYAWLVGTDVDLSSSLYLSSLSFIMIFVYIRKVNRARINKI